MALRKGCRLAVLGALLTFGAARAEKSAADLEATQHFEEGTKAYNLGEFQRAVAEYRAAYKAKADPVFLYNIAQAYRLANDLPQALFFYRTFLRNMPSTPNRRELENRISDLEAQVAQQKAVSTAPPLGTVAPGSAPAATTPKEPPTPESAHPAPAASAGGVAPGTVPAEALPVATAEATSSASTEAHGSVLKKWWLWTAVGVVVVGAAVGIGAGVASSGGGSLDPDYRNKGTLTF